MEKTDIYIFGASGHGKVVHDAAETSGWKVAAYIDDNKAGGTIRGRGIIKLEDVPEPEGKVFALGIGENKTREMIYNRIKEIGGVMPAIINKSAMVSPDSEIEEGSVVMAGVIINSGAKIGRGVILNSGCIVEHDNFIGDFAHISPGASLAGNVTVGTYTQVGIGSSVRQGVVIGAENTVGAGAAVVNDFDDGNIIVGVPAFAKKKR